MRVYHLCEAQFALSNIALQRIKISRISDLNDPFELLGVNLRDSEHRSAFRRSKDEMDRTKGLICFSKSWQNPVLWSHYADKHRGICLGFDVSDKLLHPVNYREKPIKIIFDKTHGSLRLSESFVNELLYTKYSSWEYEAEVRVFVELDHKTIESGLFFHPFSKNLQLTEVILGPRCEIPISSVRRLVAHYSPKVYVVKSRLAFTKFKVVENRAVTRKKT